jgi:hypothetical protein
MEWVDWYSATRISARISTTASKTCGGKVSWVWPRWQDSCRLAASRVRDEVVTLESMIAHFFAILELPIRTYERVQNLRPYRKGRGGRRTEESLIWVRRGGTASGDAVPRGVRHRRRREAQPARAKTIAAAHQRVWPRPWQPRHQSCVATDWEILLRPRRR